MENQKKDIAIILGIVILGAVMIVSILRDRFVQIPQWTVSVMGRGEVTYEPDEATVVLGVNLIREQSAEAALKKIHNTVTAIEKALLEAGVNEGDIETRQYVIQPQYDYINERQQLGGYEAHQYVAITIRDLSGEENVIGNVIEAATRAGANTVQSISFDSSKLEALKQEARIKAFNEARANADSMEEASGVKLKKLVSWWENIISAPNVPQPYYYEAYGGLGAGGGGGGGVPGQTVPTGDHEIIIEMTLNYLID